MFEIILSSEDVISVFSTVIDDERLELLITVITGLSPATRCVMADSIVGQGTVALLHAFLSVFDEEAYTCNARRK